MVSVFIVLWYTVTVPRMNRPFRRMGLHGPLSESDSSFLRKHIVKIILAWTVLLVLALLIQVNVVE